MRILLEAGRVVVATHEAGTGRVTDSGAETARALVHAEPLHDVAFPLVLVG